MSVFKCKMCGGTIEFEQGSTIGVCDSCGTKQTLPRLDDERRANLYDRANHFRRNNEFDKAAGIYEQILSEDTSDAEAYWSLVLCRYGIEYVEDPATHKRVPTVNRAQFTSVFDDDNYKSALLYADGYQREIYENEAKAINNIQKGILAISQKEQPFDIFVCYKETDDRGRRTHDSVLANELYHQLVQEGFKVFFSRITLEDKLGEAYEPYIFAALNSAKVMVVIGTKPEYFKAVWVKNEWSRYLALVKQSNGKKVLIPAYKDMDPYDLPDEFSHLQAQDMSKLGFMQDLIRGIKKITLSTNERTNAPIDVIPAPSNQAIDPLLRRAHIFLEDREWTSADQYAERALDIDPENSDAYLIKLFASHHFKTKDDIKQAVVDVRNDSNYIKFLRFAPEPTRTEIKEFVDWVADDVIVQERNRRLQSTYNDLVGKIQENLSEQGYLSLAEEFDKISGFLDSATKANACREKAEWLRTNYGTVEVVILSNINEDGFRVFIDNNAYLMEKPRSNSKLSLKVGVGKHTFSVGTSSGFRTKRFDFSISRLENLTVTVRSTPFSYSIHIR